MAMHCRVISPNTRHRITLVGVSAKAKPCTRDAAVNSKACMQHAAVPSGSVHGTAVRGFKFYSTQRGATCLSCRPNAMIACI